MAEEPHGKKIDFSDFDNFSQGDSEESWYASLNKKQEYTPTNNSKEPWSPSLLWEYTPTNNSKEPRSPSLLFSTSSWMGKSPMPTYSTMTEKSRRKLSSPRETKKYIKYTPTIKTPTKTTTVATKILLDDAHNGFKNGNFVCSPISLETLLGMIAAGAKDQTLKQLLEFLGHETMDQLHSESPSMRVLGHMLPDLNSGGSLDFTLANGVWVDKKLDPINSCYQDVLKTVYNTNTKYVDLENKPDQAVQEINSWVNKETRGLIPTIVDNELSKEAVIVLANALYFRGIWSSPFETHMTKSEDFHVINGETVSVPFMTSYNEKFEYGSFEEFKILKMPYKSKGEWNRFSMYILLPDKIDGLLDLLELFHSNHALFNGYFDLDFRKLDEVRIPKFKISYNLEVQDVMKEMGMILPFQLMNKDFNGILCSGSPYRDTLNVSKIIQQSFIEVDERGTEAASVTWARMPMYCASPPPPPPASFVADHPFMFMIREDTSRAVFFIGVVLNPM